VPRAAVNGIELAYESYGEGAPLVLAHGFVASKEMWDGQIEPFSQRYRVVVYDVRGHGESQAPPADDPAYALETFVEDQRTLMDHLGVAEAYVGGLSMGGMIAMRFALTYPERVRALLLCDTAAQPAGSLSGEMGRWGEHAEAIVNIARSQGVLQAMAWLYTQRGNRLLGVSLPKAMPEGVRRFIERLQRQSVDGFLGVGRALGEQTGVLERLAELRMPTLILTGEHDFLRGPSEQMKARLPDARFVLIDGAAHGTCLWQPEKFAEAVLEFLADVEAGRRVAGEVVV